MADEELILPQVEKVVPIKNCVRFWKSLLFHQRAFLPVTTVVIIEATIKHLEGISSINRCNEVDSDIELEVSND